MVDFLEQWDFSVDVHLRYATRWMDANPEASIEDAALDWLANHVDTWSAWVTEDAAAGILATLPVDPLVATYDRNGDGRIDIGELFTAIDDYFAGLIDIGELFTLIDLYFAGPA